MDRYSNDLYLSIFYTEKGDENSMYGPKGSGLALLKQQREDRNKRLEGLTPSKYYHAMKVIRDGGEPNDYIKKYMLARYN